MYDTTIATKLIDQLKTGLSPFFIEGHETP